MVELSLATVRYCGVLACSNGKAAVIVGLTVFFEIQV